MEYDGLTGPIKFTEGKRTNFKLDILKLRMEQLYKVSVVGPPPFPVPLPRCWEEKREKMKQGDGGNRELMEGERMGEEQNRQETEREKGEVLEKGQERKGRKIEEET